MYYNHFIISSLWEKEWPFILTNLNPPHPRMLCAKFGWNLPSGLWRRRFFKNLVFIISLFHNYLPLGIVGLFLWTNLNSLHTKMLCDKFGWNWSSDLSEDILKLRHCIFGISLLSPLEKKAGPFIWTNMNPLHPIIVCAKFDWNYPSGSGEEFLNFGILNT